MPSASTWRSSTGHPGLLAGLFASYHAYPYYPDFMNLDPGYAQARDHLGPSNYAGYLADLVKHHARHPVLIAEFGVPSSRVVAHWQAQGLTHGGQNEREQGEQDARLQRDIYDAGCAGGVLFAWIDEWFKKNWLTLPFELPSDRKPLWYNAMDAEENYGLIAYRPGAKGPAILIDGKAEDWARVPVYLEGGGLHLEGAGGRRLAPSGACSSRAPWTSRSRPSWWASTPWTPGGAITGCPGSRTSAARLDWSSWSASRARAAPACSWMHPTPFPSTGPCPASATGASPTKRAASSCPRPRATIPRMGRDGTRFPGHSTEIGWLRQGTQDRADPAFDSRAEWQVGRSPDGRGFLEARIPWTLLQVTDPSSRTVLDDPEAEAPRAPGNGDHRPGSDSCWRPSLPTNPSRRGMAPSA